MVDEKYRYILEHSSPQGEVLDWVEKQTNLHTNRAHMLSGPILGRFLMFLVDMLKPRRVLELGTFTGYSSICLASRLPEGGRLDSLEINDELEEVIREGFARAGLSDRISLYIGDCRETLVRLRSAGEVYDLVYMDANKREYVEYYELVIDMVRSGGYILADNVLWDSKVCGENVPTDLQTSGIAAFNDLVAADPRVESLILPIRDGLSLLRKL